MHWQSDTEHITWHLLRKLRTVVQLALSLSKEIDKFGAYAGFAAVLGLAVLALLYFSQAREVKRLREWAGRAPERAAESEQRSVELAQQRVASTPQQPVTRPPAATAGAGVQAKPAGAAATPAGGAVAAGQTVIGKPVAPVVTPTPPPPVGPTATPASTQPAKSSPALASATNTAPITPAPPIPKPPTRSHQSVPLRQTPSASAPQTARTATRRQNERSGGGSSHSNRLPLVGGGVVIVIALVLIATQLFGGGDSADRPNRAAPLSGQGSGSQGNAPLVRGKITVAVLNGTTVPGLAAQIADQVEGAGFKRGTVTNAADQQRSVTTVYYAPAGRRAAKEIAKISKIADVQPIDSGTQAIAGQDAAVVVVVGADRTQ